MTYSRKDHLRVCGADPYERPLVIADLGSSPRVRSRPPRQSRGQRRQRIISACAEQTWGRRGRGRACRDHLRVCGADTAIAAIIIAITGSSPRVRSRHDERGLPAGERGIISACAEQTLSASGSFFVSGDHLRVCGADLGLVLFELGDAGSSPRVRSRRRRSQPGQQAQGIISACAEQTVGVSSSTMSSGDHLRVCGADRLGLDAVTSLGGSSPRVRSRHGDGRIDGLVAGIISACAEQTTSAYCASGLSQDHLRVCGADLIEETAKRGAVGSSPRVRSRPIHAVSEYRSIGIISACAEQTSHDADAVSSGRDHLRVCGADS